MKINRRTVVTMSLIVSMLLSFVFVNLNISPVFAQTTLYIDPTPITASVCSNFTVALNIAYVTDLYAWEVKMSFNPSLLECLGATQGPFLPPPTIWVPPIIDNVAGTVHMGCARMISPGQSGSGTLAYITFHCKGLGECDLVFLYPPTWLMDSQGFSIPHEAINGHVIQIQPVTEKVLHGESLFFSVRLHADFLINLYSPISTIWHELWPYYCRRYHLTSWIDNGDEMLSPSDQIDMIELETEEKTWWHVDDVTVTIKVSEIGVPSPTSLYLEFMPGQGFPMYNHALLKVLCIWHEVYPVFSPQSAISQWVDNGDGILSYCDKVYWAGKWYHVEQVATDIIVTRKPICTQWHEIYPEFCMHDYHLSSWIDNGDHVLSWCDKIDLTDKVTGEVTWWHVRDVTVTMVLTEKYVPPPIEPMYVEYIPIALSPNPIPPPQPASTYWHEIWPVYCRYYHLSSWEDNGDGWLSPSDQIDMTDEFGKVHYYHVDDISIDIWIEPIPQPIHDVAVVSLIPHLTSVVQGQPVPIEVTVHNEGDQPEIAGYYVYIDPDGSPDSGDETVIYQETDTLYPCVPKTATFNWDTTGVPPATYPLYAEILPVPGETDLTDNLLEDGAVTVTLPYKILHGEAGLLYQRRLDAGFLVPLAPPPISTLWHELWPYYCRMYHLTSWEDDPDNPDGMLSPSDQIDMFEYETEQTTWWHVDDVTITLYLKDKEGILPPMYIESVGGFPMYWEVLYRPLSTKWHEIYPLYCRYFHLSSWIDSDGNGMLNPSDQIDITDYETGEVTWWHVENVSTDIIVTRKPVCTQWHEIFPDFCMRDYHLSSWEDNGDHELSPSDQIDLTNKKTGEVTWWHVKDVTITIVLTEKDAPPPIKPLYLEYTYGFERLYEPLTYPVCTFWHEIWPVYCRYYHLTSWYDNGDGWLSPSDQIDMTDEQGNVHWYHVDDVTIDIIIEPKPPCPMPPQVKWKHKFAKIDYFMTFCPSPGVANLNYDPNLEIVTGTDEWYGNQKWYAFTAAGGILWTLPTRVDESRTSVAIGDIDGDGDLEMAGGTTSGWETQVFNSAGGFVWRYSDPTRYDWWHSTPAMCDVNPTSPGLEVIAAEYGYGGNPKIFCFSKTGSVLWSYTIPEGGIVDASPACGDIDGDGVVEIVIGTAPPNGQPHYVYCFNGMTGAVKWRHRVTWPPGSTSTCSNRAVHSSAAIADIDNDGMIEVIFGANDGRVRCLRGTDGTAKWYTHVGGCIYSSPAVGDVDADGALEIIVGSTNHRVYCLSSTGAVEWSFLTGGDAISSAALANRGTTPGLGIYIGSKDGYLYLLDGLGNLIWRFNTGATNGITSSPAVADIDGDSKLEVMFTDWNAIPDDPAVTNVFWCLVDCTSWVEPYATEWPMFRHDRCHTGKYSSGIKGMSTVASEGKTAERSTEILSLEVHDVEVVFDWLSKTFIKAGETVEVYVTVYNRGNVPETTTVTVTYDGTPIGSAPVTLNPDEEKELTFSWDTTGVPKGVYSVTAEASVVPGETDTVDNDFSTLAIITLPVHDIAIAYVAPSKSVVYGGGYLFEVDVTLFNQGDYIETFIVTTSYGSNPIGPLGMVTLNPGESLVLSLTCNSSGLPKGTDTAGAYIVTPIIGETDTADDTCTDGDVLITKAGDLGSSLGFFKCDGTIDGFDLALFIQCYNDLAPPEAMYLGDLGSSLGFFKCDGTIDGFDLALFIQCYNDLGPDP